MKAGKILILVFICVFSNSLRAQNFVSNHSFESGLLLSNYGWYPGLITDWNTTNPSPDRYHFLDPFPFSRDNHPPQSGLSYVLMHGQYREAGKNTLITPLLPGHLYRLTYYLDVDNNFDYGPGAFNFHFNGGDSLYSPFIVNSGNWQYFDTTFTVTSPASELELIAVGLCFMKIDNISITELNTSLDDENDDENMWVFPNPSNGVFTVSGFKKEMNINWKVINTKGQVVLSSEEKNQNMPADEQMLIDLSSFPNGTYYLITIKCNRLNYYIPLVKN